MRNLLGILAGLFVASVVVGCSETKPEPAPAVTSQPRSGQPPEMKPVPGEADSLTAEEIAEIKKLPVEDQKLAMEQKYCPIGEGHLGDPAMGPPVKIDVKGKTVFLCCAGCKGKAEKNPDAVLAKLEEFKKSPPAK